MSRAVLYLGVPLGCVTISCFLRYVLHNLGRMRVSSILPPIFQVTKYTLWSYLITVFCAGIVVISEGIFHSLVSMNSSDTAHLGVYEEMRTTYAQGRIASFLSLSITDASLSLGLLGQVMVLG